MKTGLDQQPAQPDVWLTTSEVAALFKLGKQTLDNWRSADVGPPFYRLGGKRVLYKLSEVEGYLAQRRVQPRRESGSHAAAT